MFDGITTGAGAGRVGAVGRAPASWGGLLLGVRFRAYSPPTTRASVPRACERRGKRWLVRAYYSAMRFRLLAGLLLGLRFRACVCEQGELFRDITKLVQDSP